MKIIFFFVVLLLFICPIAHAQVQPVNKTFAWEQSNYDRVNYWILSWGESPGGPYTVGNIRIDKTVLAESQTSPVVIQYPDQAMTTYYFTLIAYIDADHYSGLSNELLLEIDFIGQPDTPVNLRIMITPAP